MGRTTAGRIATLAFGSVLFLTAWPCTVRADPPPVGAPAPTSTPGGGTGPSSGPTTTGPTTTGPTTTGPTTTGPTTTGPTSTGPTTTGPTSTSNPPTSSPDEPVVVCAPNPPAPGSDDDEAAVEPCATLPAAPSVPGALPGVTAIAQAFRGVADDSTDSAEEEMTSSLLETQQETRDQLEQRAPLPQSLDRGLLNVPGTGETVRLDVTVDGRNRQSRNSGPGLRDYGSRGERGVRTVLQQLPGENIRVYKVIDRHRGEPGEPTVLRFRLSTSVRVSDEYTYIGHPGVVLIDPDGRAGQLEGHRGTPIGFLTEPVALDANSQPVAVTWTLRNRTLELRVQDSPGTAYPVVVDPTFYPRTWMAQASNGAPLLAFVGRAGQGDHESAPAVAAAEVAAAMTAAGCPPGTPLTWLDATGDFYREVWARVLPCLAEG